MLANKKILEQAALALKNHSSDLAALHRRKQRKTKRPVRLRVDLPHLTAMVSEKLQKKRVIVSGKGVRVILFEGKIPVGTMDFTFEKKRLRFSHFTFGKKTRPFYRHIKRIYEAYKISDDTLLELLKITALGKSVIRFHDGKTRKYFDLDLDNDSPGVMGEVDFIKMYNAQWKKLQSAEKKFLATKTRKRVEAMDRLSYLNYL